MGAVSLGVGTVEKVGERSRFEGFNSKGFILNTQLYCSGKISSQDSRRVPASRSSSSGATTRISYSERHADVQAQKQQQQCACCVRLCDRRRVAFSFVPESTHVHYDGNTH
ncbi:hypothetical protein ACLOJK_037875 [Asimina triloba]